MTLRALAAMTVLGLAAGAARAQDTTMEPPVECAPPAQPGTAAELASRAQEHYKEATRLYNVAEYERAVEEFNASFCLFPTPEAAKNVGQSYYSLLDFEKAILWWEYFVFIVRASQPQQATLYSSRIDRLRKLPARIRVATVPQGATISVLEGPKEITRGLANAAPIKVPAGAYTLRVESPGYTPVVEEIRAEIGQPYTYSYRLEPETGALRINAEPTTARIFVDGRLVGSGRYDDRLPTGPHAVLVESEGRLPERRTVLVTGQTPTMLNVRLSVPPRNGRTELLTAATSWGLVSGGTVGLLLQQDTAFIFTFAGGTASFVLGYVAIPRRIPVGTSSTAIGASLWGGLEGLATSLIVSRDADVVAPVTLAASAVVGVGGAFVADRLRLSAGDAAVVNSGALWGTVTGFLTWRSFTEEEDPLEGLGPPLVLAGVNVGLLAGITMAQRYEITRAHVALIDLSAVTGTFVGLGGALLVPDQTQRGRVENFMLGGMAAGLVLGALLTRNYDETGDLTPLVSGVRPIVGRAEGGARTFGLVGEF